MPPPAPAAAAAPATPPRACGQSPAGVAAVALPMFVDGSGGSGGSPVYSQSSQNSAASRGTTTTAARKTRLRRKPSRVRRERWRASASATASSPENAPQPAQRPPAGDPAPAALIWPQKRQRMTVSLAALILCVNVRLGVNIRPPARPDAIDAMRPVGQPESRASPPNFPAGYRPTRNCGLRLLPSARL